VTRVNPPTHCVRCGIDLPLELGERGHEWDLCADCSIAEAWTMLGNPKQVRKSVLWLVYLYHDRLQAAGLLDAVSGTAHEQR